ncbi:MAG: MaoC family dehydratase [Rhizobiaceae bacterium]
MSTPTFFELLESDMKIELGSHTFGAEEIILFATKFDPQPFHLSDEGARNSHFGKLCASGWHTASIWMRKNMDNGIDEMIRMTGYEGPAPVLGPSPGIKNIRWQHPVFVGDTIRYSSTLTTKKRHPKRSEWGRVMNQSHGVNQDGKLVFSMDGSVTMRVD